MPASPRGPVKCGIDHSQTYEQLTLEFREALFRIAHKSLIMRIKAKPNSTSVLPARVFTLYSND
nr:MAG TPA: hypothetical protein [Caudoviricetes sp.]